MNTLLTVALVMSLIGFILGNIALLKTMHKREDTELILPFNVFRRN